MRFGAKIAKANITTCTNTKEIKENAQNNSDYNFQYIVLRRCSCACLPRLWQWIDVPPFEDLVDVQFVNSKLGWIADGWIRKTNDGGENFQVQYRNRGIDITGIYFVDAQEGWAIGSEGKIFTTKDGGETWERISSANEELRDIFFLNNGEGWIVGGEEKSFILHTQNGGQTWSIKERNFTVPLKKVHFVNSKEGWAVGGVWRPGFRTGIILHTKDGMNWEQQLEVRPPLEGVDFVDENEGWVVGSGAAIFHTKDGGRNWERQNAGEINTHLTDVLFLDTQKGWIVGWDGLVLHTEDGGENWQIQRNSRQDNPFLAYYETLYDICYDGKSTLWAVGRNGLILKYTDPALEAYPVSTPADKIPTTWGREG
ncbi:TPA: hypothetical protein EYP66_21535 [Candidatus Poribacteria bacterium]|nr:hypothetical protein [Candidatus Poribacteria bacterium]